MDNALIYYRGGEGRDLIDLQVFVKDVVEGMLWISEETNFHVFYGPAGAREVKFNDPKSAWISAQNG